ncbi:MAG: LytTR family DNA-binding domain-containing protein [Bacteroidales bacterium]|jgi:DNA-binding LytR/AlgR family response regulator|nr:LytTR family DNA-binding domain-containing protein [Bacteroidales bacterium]
MNCIIVDDEPLAREGIKLLVDTMPQLKLCGMFSNTLSAMQFLETNAVDLIFLDIEMPGINGIEFARTISRETLIIFTTAFAEYAAESYEVDAVDYLVKPIEEERFRKAVEGAFEYKSLLSQSEENTTEGVRNEYIFVKSDRRFIKLNFSDIAFVEALKDYIIIHTARQRIITRMNLKAINAQLPVSFIQVSKSYIINTDHITSFDNNSIMIGTHEVLIGNSFRPRFFDDYVAKKILHPNK